MKKMGLPAKKRDSHFTYQDYKSWPEEERWELIHGIAYSMSPAPTTEHQRLSRKLSTKLDTFLSGKNCELFTAPFDVYFPNKPKQEFNLIDTIVQPDLSVICDSTKIIEKGCLGAPDLIVEILSPSTSKKDLNEKFQLYEKSGVREYWVVDPGNKFIQVFHLQSEGPDKGKYDQGTLTPPSDWRENNTIAESKVLKGFSVDLEELFR